MKNTQDDTATEGCAAAAGYGRVVERLLPMEWEERTGRTIKVHPRDMTTHQRSTLDTLITLPSYLAFLRRLDLRHTHKLMDADLKTLELAQDAPRRSMQRLVLHSSVVLFLGDCMEILPTLELGVIITDPPYGMKKADWDEEIPNWLPLAGTSPVATFCGVVGMRDYPTPDWIGAWVRQGSTQRNGKLKGFNNWEPILFYNIPALKNDVIAVPNYHDDHGHPSVKPDKLMAKLMELMPPGAVVDPFMGTGTTGIAAIRARRSFVGIERDPKHFETARRRLQAELDADLFMQNA